MSARSQALRPRTVGLYAALACLIAFALSTRFLLQPFVWRNFTFAEVLWGWLLILRDRLIVAAAITIAILVLVELLRLRTLSVIFGVVAGAVGGEVLVRTLRGEPLDGLAAHALHWSVVALAVGALLHAWRTGRESRRRFADEALARAKLESELADTRLTALTNQIEPHFLFNTLATVRRLQQTEPVTGARVLTSFVDYLRRTLDTFGRREISLGEEIELLRQYLAIIEVRMSGRLRVDFAIPAELLQTRVPPLLLATLAENAVKHGVARCTWPADICIQAERRHEGLVLEVRDTGAGLHEDAHSGSGTGLSNVRARLQTLHGARASLKVTANEPHGVRAIVMLPA